MDAEVCCRLAAALSVRRDRSWPPEAMLSMALRTTQTAGRVADALGLTMTPDERLRERQFGALEGLGDEHYPNVWALDAMGDEHSAFQVESLQSVAARMKAVIDAFEREHRGETLLIVSHGDPLQILLTALANKPLTQHREQTALLPASITQVGG
ncbi:histidine phosphatase family protein [Halomonas sp. SpR1]|uniref:histidine phosphatase family protein n=1 Tax=Halomonas sp. SpR1 TaxID=3050462 RepID=UPI0027E42D02|nr:histidine phosphatase family protein [Halomonas sp. SpR1]